MTFSSQERATRESQLGKSQALDQEVGSPNKRQLMTDLLSKSKDFSIIPFPFCGWWDSPFLDVWIGFQETFDEEPNFPFHTSRQGIGSQIIQRQLTSFTISSFAWSSVSYGCVFIFLISFLYSPTIGRAPRKEKEVELMTCSTLLGSLEFTFSFSIYWFLFSISFTNPINAEMKKVTTSWYTVELSNL